MRHCRSIDSEYNRSFIGNFYNAIFEDIQDRSMSRVSFQCSGSDCFSGSDSSAFLFQKSDSVQFENLQGGIARKSSGVKITVLLCFLLAERDKMKEENG